MEAHPLSSKLLIPSRPYNPPSNTNVISSISIPEPINIIYNTDKVSELISIIKNEEDQKIISQKIQVPKRGHEIINPIINQQNNLIKSNPLAELRKNLNDMRNSIKNKLKNAISDAKSELIKLDDMENALIKSFDSENQTNEKVKTNFSEFFLDLKLEIFQQVDSNANLSQMVLPGSINLMQNKVNPENILNKPKEAKSVKIEPKKADGKSKKEEKANILEESKISKKAKKKAKKIN